MSRLTAMYKDLLFLHGHVADPSLALSLSGPTPERATTRHRSTPMNFFKSLMYLGGLESVDLRINEDGSPYRPYGNHEASAARFGATPRTAPTARERRQPERRRVARASAQAAACH
jgi:hypothetical protein